MKYFFLLFHILLYQISLAQTNLVKNGSFETELTYWRGDVATISPYDQKSGKNSCSINQFVGAEWKGIDQIIVLPKNTAAVEISGWVKTEAIEKGKSEWNTGKFDIEFLNFGEQGIKNQSIASVLGTTPWTFYKKIVTIPSGASKFRIMLALGQTNGSIFFDDIKAVAITLEQLNNIHQEEHAKTMAGNSSNSESKPTDLSNGNFENEMASWRGNAAISTSIFKEGKAALLLNSNTFDWTGIDQTADVPDNVRSITLSGWLKSDNIKQGKDPWNNGLFNVEFTGSDTKKTSDDHNIAIITATTDWTFYTKTFPIPAGTKKYRIMLALGFASGTFYADGITVSFL